MPGAKKPSDEIKDLFKRAAPVSTDEKLAHFKEQRQAMGGNQPIALSHAPPTV